VKLVAAWATDVGRVRPGNEDAILIDDRLGVFAVADGMGGHVAGEVASSTAVEAVRAAIANGDTIDEAIRAANRAVRERAALDPELAGMGTTLTAVVPLDGAHVLIGHVGDSRAYLLHDAQLRRLTDDHSLVEELLREGRITEEQAEVHPQRSIITRAIGVEPAIDVDLYTITVRNGDRILICSDGLTDMLRESDIERLADRSVDAATAADQLVVAANDAGGGDNITVVVLDVTEIDDEPSLFDASVIDAAESRPAPAASTPEDGVDAAGPHNGGVPAPAASPRRRVRRTLAALVVAMPLIAIIAVGMGFTWWRSTHTYYVGESRGAVVVYRGVPGGLLFWDPTVVERTDLKTGTLAPLDRDRVRAGFCEGTRSEAGDCVQELRDRREARPSPTTTSSSRSTTSTTAAPTPTVTPTSRPPTSTTLP